MTKQKPKLSVFPKGYMDEIINEKMSLFEWIDIAAKLNVQGLELYPDFLKTNDKSWLSKVKKKVEMLDLKIPMMCSSPDFTHPDKNFRKKEMEKMKRMIDVMDYLGPKEFRSCRVLSGQKRPEVTRWEGIKWTVECIKELLVYAEERNVYLLIENHYKDGYWRYSEFAQSKEIFMEIVNKIDSPFFGINFDPSNALFAGEDPINFFKAVKEKVITLHASDRYLKKGYTWEDLQNNTVEGYSEALDHGVIGKGLNNYEEIFTILKEMKFYNWISIEDGVNGYSDLKQSADFLNDKIKEYFG